MAYESGDVAPNKKSLEEIAAALGISLGKLFAYTPPNLEIVWSHFTMADDLPDWA